jgi:hypothetical protein
LCLDLDLALSLDGDLGVVGNCHCGDGDLGFGSGFSRSAGWDADLSDADLSDADLDDDLDDNIICGFPCLSDSRDCGLDDDLDGNMFCWFLGAFMITASDDGEGGVDLVTTSASFAFCLASVASSLARSAILAAVNAFAASTVAASAAIAASSSASLAIAILSSFAFSACTASCIFTPAVCCASFCAFFATFMCVLHIVIPSAALFRHGPPVLAAVPWHFFVDFFAISADLLGLL